VVRFTNHRKEDNHLKQIGHNDPLVVCQGDGLYLLIGWYPMFKYLFTNNETNLVSYLAKMRNPQQMVLDLHNAGVEVCFDQAEELINGIHDEGMDEKEIHSICGL